MPAQSVDIAIVGAGPAGLSLAALLENHGYSYKVYERSREDTPPRGGSLDLHPGSGQRVIQEAGLQEVFDKVGRRGSATLHRVFDYNLNPLLSWGEGRDAPEIDRGALRNVLVAGIGPGRIQYRKKLIKAQRNEHGSIVLQFEDGTEASGFKLVVGADGVYSKIRPLVSFTTSLLASSVAYSIFRSRPLLSPYSSTSSISVSSFTLRA